jgi:hypothetical protein
MFQFSPEEQRRLTQMLPARGAKAARQATSSSGSKAAKGE